MHCNAEGQRGWRVARACGLGSRGGVGLNPRCQRAGDGGCGDPALAVGPQSASGARRLAAWPAEGHRACGKVLAWTISAPLR